MPPKKNCKLPGLGDRVRRGLDSIGITRQRYWRAMIYLRLADPSKGCGCGKRAEKLNRIGDSLLSWWRSLYPINHRTRK